MHGRRKPLWVPLGLTEGMLGWLAWREQQHHAGAGEAGGSGGVRAWSPLMRIWRRSRRPQAAPRSSCCGWRRFSCPGGCRPWPHWRRRWMSGSGTRRCARGGLRCCGCLPLRTRTRGRLMRGRRRGLLLHDLSVLAVLQT